MSGARVAWPGAARDRPGRGCVGIGVSRPVPPCSPPPSGSGPNAGSTAPHSTTSRPPPGSPRAPSTNFAGKTDLLLALMERITSDRTPPRRLRRAPRRRGGRRPHRPLVPRHDTEDGPRRLALLLVEFWLYGMRDYARKLAHRRLVRRTPRPTGQRTRTRGRHRPRRPRHPHPGPRLRPGLPTPPGPGPSPCRPLQDRQVPNASPPPHHPANKPLSPWMSESALIHSSATRAVSPPTDSPERQGRSVG